MLSSVGRPVIELKGFDKIFLEAGQEKEVILKVKVQDLAFYNEQGDWEVEAGEFRIMVGNSSKNLPLKTSIHVL
jgi:beta-glucosidase